MSVTLRLPRDQREGIKRDLGLFAQDKWATRPHHAEPRRPLRQVHRQDPGRGLLAGRFNAAQHFGKCADGKNNAKNGCVGDVQNWKDISPRVGVAWDVFGNGRTAVKASVARYVNGEAVGTAPPPATTRSASLGLTDIASVDRRRQATARRSMRPATSSSTNSTNSASTPTFGKNVSTTQHRPGRAERLVQARLQLEYTVQRAAPDRRPHVGQRRLLSPHVRQPDLHRRPALRRQTATTVRSASRRRPTRICPAAAATRSAACRTSSRRCSRRTCRPTA